MEEKEMTADFLKEETRMKERKRFDERLKRQGMEMCEALASAFGAKYDKKLRNL